MASSVAVLTAIMAFAAAPLMGAITTWDGSESYDWTDPDNWSNGVPINSDFNSDAYIGTGTPGTITNIPSSPSQHIKSINFTTAGWTLQGGFNFFKDLSSSGSGTNTITGNMNELRNNAAFDIGMGNTLVIGGYLRQYQSDITLQGGGTLKVDHLRSSDFGSPEIFLYDITLQIQNANPYPTSSHEGEIHLMSEDAVLMLLTSNVAFVESLYGSDDGGIFDDLGGTDRLQAVYNSTTGYTEVTLITEAVPEPASIATWAVLGLCLVGFGYCRHRRKT